ncbi:MAG: trypsin-like peptidase domain-containing protein [Bacteroidia bacterium]|nr:trypsin-like peptidase domain-containing protein [Bacteroidia bacterium]
MHNPQDVIEHYKGLIIQISTPQSTGSGFYLKDYGLIITNYHVIKGFTEVTISGQKFKNTLSQVLFTDAKHDLAFLHPPEGVDMPHARIPEEGNVRDGDVVIAIGHPFGLSFTSTSGIVSKARRLKNGIDYIQIDAAINPGNSGGPLVNVRGEIVGVNTFIVAEGDNLGFALHIDHLRDALKEYYPYKGQLAVRCHVCNTIVTHENIDDKYCPSCGTEITLPKTEDNYVPTGIAAIIETILNQMGKEVKIARRGTNNWEIEEGSAKIWISYNQDSYFVIGDATLCSLPKTNISAIYEFLLRENYNLKSLTFSVNNNHIMLSFIIYDEDLTVETGLAAFRNLAEKADYYDNILIEKYGAIPRQEEIF